MEINLLNKPFELGHKRSAEAVIKKTKCDITGVETWCVVVDTSEGEYGELAISIAHLNIQLKSYYLI